MKRAAVLIFAALICGGQMEAKPLGPTFGDELAAAGLAGVVTAWNSDGTFPAGAFTLTPQQQSALNALIAAHDPSKQLSAATQRPEVVKLIDALIAQGTIPAGARTAIINGLK